MQKAALKPHRSHPVFLRESVLVIKQRLDLLLVERQLASSREKAQALILAGQVLVADVPMTKPGTRVPSDAPLRLREQKSSFVSRGGLKLEKALEQFGIVPEGKTALDVGASTGGFTDVLLQKGARKVFAVDVGHNQLDWKVRSDPRVVVKEKFNARYLEFDDIGERVDVIVVDVSFISLRMILPSLKKVASLSTDWITLIKPQFEVGRSKVGKGGIVRELSDRIQAVQDLTKDTEKFGLRRLGLIDSPITGTNGNYEFLAHWKIEE